jgi:FkbM family methyltransferase
VQDALKQSAPPSANGTGSPPPPAAPAPRRSLIARAIGRLAWYVRRLKMDNHLIGRWIEFLGNRVKIDGLTFNVDNPLIRREHKSTIYFGIYEEPERRFVRRFLRAESTVIELGGSIGVVSCMINQKLAEPRRHVVVEANPMLVPTLHRNRELNKCEFRVVNAAIAYGVTEVAFSSRGHFLMGSLASCDDPDAQRVPACTLQQLLGDLAETDMVLVSDIEGAEIALVEHDGDLIASRFGMIIMETHPGVVGEAVNGAMLGSLANRGFSLAARDRDVVVLVRR